MAAVRVPGRVGDELGPDYDIYLGPSPEPPTAKGNDPLNEYNAYHYTPPPKSSTTPTTTSLATTQSVSTTPNARPVELASSRSTGGVWLELRECESSDNYQDDTGNGFYGAYQFLWSTWSSLGYPGRPDLAPPWMQDEAAERDQAVSGWGQWQACSERLGL